MNPKTLLILILILLSNSYSSLNAIPCAKASSFSNQISDEKKNEIIMAINYDIAKEYFKQIKKEKGTPAIGNFGWSEIRRYWNEVPKLKKLRNDFEKADKEFIEFIAEKDDRIKVSEGNVKLKNLTKEQWATLKSVVYNDVRKKYPKEYARFFNKRETKLRSRNIKTMDYIFKDYHKNDKIFPINWIPPVQLQKIVTAEFVQDFAKKNGYPNLGIKKVEQ